MALRKDPAWELFRELRGYLSGAKEHFHQSPEDGYVAVEMTLGHEAQWEAFQRRAKLLAERLDTIVRSWKGQPRNTLIEAREVLRRCGVSYRDMDTVEKASCVLLRRRLSGTPNHEGTGACRRMRDVEEEIREAAQTDLPVLLLGETGTGKSYYAAVIHSNSSRRQKGFVPTNCASFGPELVSGALFGHTKGSHSTAHTTEPGFSQLANGGTLFLDELGDLPKQQYAVLYTFLDSGRTQRAGATIEKVDVRIIAATNHANRLPLALIRRFTGGVIHLPPLRELKDDIPELAKRFLEVTVRPQKTAEAEARKQNAAARRDAAKQHKAALRKMPPAERAKEIQRAREERERRKAREKEMMPKRFPEVTKGRSLQLTWKEGPELADYHWPGNTGQLKTAIEHAVRHHRKHGQGQKNITAKEILKQAKQFEEQPGPQQP